MLSLILYGFVCYYAIQIFFDIADRRQRKFENDPIYKYI